MQIELANYETEQQEHPHPDYPGQKLGSMSGHTDPFDAVAGTGPAGMLTEYVAAERRPVEFVPDGFLPIETQPTNFIIPEHRQRDFRPRRFP